MGFFAAIFTERVTDYMRVRITTRHFVTLLIALCVGVLPVVASADTTVTLDSGYRSDHVDFNIAGYIASQQSQQYVNILSELNWRHIQSVQTQLGVRHDFTPRLFVEGSVDYGENYAGENQDSDYSGDDRTDEFSRSNNTSDGGHVSDFSIDLGRRVLGDTKHGEISALGGYSVNRQYFTMTNGDQTLSQQNQPIGTIPQVQPLGPFSGLNSSYSPHWNGPWLGAEARKALSAKLSLHARAEYHWTAYSAEGDWNLIPDFAHPDSFTNTGNGHGGVLSAGADYRIASAWQVGLHAGYSAFTVHNGIDTVYFSDGVTPPTSTRLNAVHWDSTTVSVQLAHQF
jgi:hypothetical protein